MKWIVLSFFSCFILGCSSTSLTYKKNEIRLQNDTFVHSISGNTLDTKHINLSQIFIEQRIFKSEYNEILLYEDARVNTGYKFKFTYQYILSHIFDTSKVTKVHEQKGLGFYILDLKSKKKVYLIAKVSSKKSLTFVYGFHKKNFNALLSQQSLVQQESVKPKSLEQIQTLWSPKLIIMGTLLQSDRVKPLR